MAAEDPELAPERIGERLRLVRKAYGLEKAEIADMLGIDRTSWIRFERGERVIPLDKAYRVVERFRVTLDFIMLGRWGGLSVDVADRLRAARNI